MRCNINTKKCFSFQETFFLPTHKQKIRRVISDQSTKLSACFTFSMNRKRKLLFPISNVVGPSPTYSNYDFSQKVHWNIEKAEKNSIAIILLFWSVSLVNAPLQVCCNGLFFLPNWIFNALLSFNCVFRGRKITLRCPGYWATSNSGRSADTGRKDSIMYRQG